jgi:hypothetical protein
MSANLVRGNLLMLFVWWQSIELEATVIDVLLDRLLLVLHVELASTELLHDAENYLCLALIKGIWAAAVAVS